MAPLSAICFFLSVSQFIEIFLCSNTFLGLKEGAAPLLQ
jgi:hypothetical protein